MQTHYKQYKQEHNEQATMHMQSETRKQLNKHIMQNKWNQIHKRFKPL